jgi:carbon storage regulator
LGEALVIDGGIEVVVTEISGDHVKIGINAPKDCKVLRKELCQTVESNREAAAARRSRRT